MDQEAKVVTKDEVLPSGKWSFDGDVTAAFDDMLARSIPQYEVMRRTVFDLGRSFVRHGTAIFDLGCSRGEALAPFVQEFGAYCSYVGLEVSGPMLEAARSRFKALIDVGVVRIVGADLRQPFDCSAASLVLSVLTLQFTPIEHRPRILADVYRGLVTGGALLLVEKVIGKGMGNDEVFTRLYYDMKREHGYTQEQIDRKRLSLEGVLVPLTAAGNEQMLQDAGFVRIECFWRWCNFAAWLAVK